MRSKFSGLIDGIFRKPNEYGDSYFVIRDFIPLSRLVELMPEAYLHQSILVDQLLLVTHIPIVTAA